MYAISVRDLVKEYSRGPRAVDRISFDASQGDIFGFLGPNGAGKTTTLRILATLLPKTAGHVEILGQDLDQRPKEIRRLVGVANQTTGLDPLATGIEILNLLARLYGLDARERQARVERLIETLGLSEVAYAITARYSGGMKRRLDLACALLHKPQVLLLDEPSVALDPQARRALWDYLRSSAEGGTCIFLTTQSMEEAEILSSKVCIVDCGKIVAEGTTAELKSRIGTDKVTIRLRPGAAFPASLEEALANFPGHLVSRQQSEGEIALEFKYGSQALPDFVMTLKAIAGDVDEVKLTSPSLEDVFFRATGRHIRSDSE